jgi:hypothetical protein
MQKAKDRQKAYANAKRSEVPEEIALGRQVLLSTQHLRLNIRGSPKLMPRYIGPFTITEVINPVAYRLELPENMKVHDVFHVSLLEPYSSNGRVLPPPPLEFINGLPEYNIEEILDCEDKGSQYEKMFLVKWLGYGPEHNTWEPESGLTEDHTKENQYIIEFWQRRKALRETGDKPPPRRKSCRKRKR